MPMSELEITYTLSQASIEALNAEIKRRNNTKGFSGSELLQNKLLNAGMAAGMAAGRVAGNTIHKGMIDSNTSCQQQQGFPTAKSEVLNGFTSVEMLTELKKRGGHPGAIAEAVLLCIKKSEDYNSSEDNTSPHTIDRTSYFPLGKASYAQMLHTKSQRFLALVKKEQLGGKPNFEGLRDTALDIINYAGFFLADESIK